MLTTKPIPLKVASYMPDLPDFQNPGSPNARNVVPRTATSFGPVQAPMQYNGGAADAALNLRCQGAAAFIDLSGNIYQFAGDQKDLYEYSVASGWVPVSKSIHPYAVPVVGQWFFSVFNGVALATDGADNIQAFTLGSSTTYADLAGSPPKAMYMDVIKNAFLMLGNTIDTTNGTRNQRVWWSPVGNITSWPTPGTVAAAQVMSSYNDLTGAGGAVQGISGNLTNADVAVLQQHALFRGIYNGPPDVFDFYPVQGAKGCPAPGSVCQAAGSVFYLSEDGFCRFDGLTVTPIGVDQVDKTFLADLDQNNISRMGSAVDPINKLIFWPYPGAGNSGGNPNRVLVHRYDLGRWSILDITLEFIMRLLSIGYTLDQLHTVLGYSLDNLPAPLDSRIWQGGNVLMGMFDLTHKVNYLTGTNLQATIDSGEAQFFPGKRSFIDIARPWVDGGVPQICVGKRDRLTDTVTYTQLRSMNAFGTCPQRTTGRYTRLRTIIPAGHTWTNYMGLEIEAEMRGGR
jgi:hypothetical protein